MLSICDVTFGYALRGNILSGFSLSLGEGERVCLSGPSGSGKTTVLRLAAGLIRPKSGQVTLAPGTSLSYVFQENRLIPWKSVYENAALFAQGGGEEVRELLRETGLSDAADLLPGELSGGMKRRAALVRALAHPFDLLLLDEPFTGLDGEARERCVRAVNRALKGKALLMASHDLAEAEMLGARVVEIS